MLVQRKMTSRPTIIWIDADACPKVVKELIYKAATRTNTKVILVANAYQTIPLSPLFEMIVVGKGDDVADQYIVDHVSKNDLVITADIPLAAKVVEKEAWALNPRGEIYDEDNIGEILSMRNFMKDLRDSGSITGGPASFSKKDIEQFANSLNKILSRK